VGELGHRPPASIRCCPWRSSGMWPRCGPTGEGGQTELTGAVRGKAALSWAVTTVFHHLSERLW